MRTVGLLIIAVSLLVPLYWFVPIATTRDPGAALSQYLGVSALIAMGLSQLMATRFRFLETIFGGLDRIYVLHKWLGIMALAALVLHDTIDADMRGLGGETWLSDLAETLGEVSFYSLIALVVLSIATFVPYHLWRYTHKFMGACFTLGAFHFAFILKPFSNQDPLGLYVLAFCAIGIASYLYTLVPWRTFQGRYAYRVNEVEHLGSAVSLTLSPGGPGMRHKPGQFAFLQLEQDGVRSVHPFTISQAPSDERSLRFTIKALGDHTKRVSQVASQGTAARISGPYGHFQPAAPDVPEIWIAGGIGITPFLAWAGSLEHKTAPVHLFYSLRDASEAVHLDELRALQQQHHNFHLHLIETTKTGRLTVGRIVEALDSPLQTCRASFCGPKPMREQLKRDLTAKGLPGGAFMFEEFEIRSGLGLRKLLACLFGRFTR